MSDISTPNERYDDGPKSKWNTLSEREKEVAFRLATGDKNSEIAKALNISIKTVDTHRGHVLKKLDCRNNVALLRFMLLDNRVVL